MKKLDWTSVNKIIENYKNDYNLNSNSVAFSYCILEKLFPYHDESIEELLTEGGNDCGVDAIKIDRSGNNAHIHIFQFKFHESIRKSENYFKANQADKMITFIDRLFDEDVNLEKISNPFLWDKIQEIWSVYQNANTKITIYFCSNGKSLEKNQTQKVENAFKKYKIDLEEIDAEGLVNLLISPAYEKTLHSFTAIEKQYLGRSDGDIKGFVGSISAKDLINMIRDKDNPDKLCSNIFDKNIRVFLGRENPVNESIIKTAVSNRNTYFWYLNNGITAMCSNLSYRDNMRSPVVDIENLQIVNGAQTSNALFEAAKNKPEILEDILLLIKVYETKNPDLPHQIALATNSQTRIFPRDLMSNSEVQIKLEKAFESLGFFYERKKNQHEDKDQSLRIDSLKLGQVILAFYLREPERSKKDSDKIFGSLYEDVFSLEHDIEHLKNMFLVFQKIEEMKVDANRLRKKNITDKVDEFLTYGQFHIIYLVALLSERKCVDIKSEKKRERLINDALEIMRAYIEVTKTNGFYVFFRNPKTKEGLFEMALGKGQLSLPFELKSMPA